MTQDLIIAGGGLSGVLTAVALADARPDIRVTLVEAGQTLGGNHTWSFFATDLDAAGTSLVEPFVAHRWSSYEVRFSGSERVFSTAYRSITSEGLHRVAMARLGESVRLGRPVRTLDAHGVTLDGGERLAADTVIDARGPGRLAGVELRWQKFLGREVRVDRPHGLHRPIIMDARVAQLDGYRFVYVLPLAEDRLLVEDTYYSDSAALDAGKVGERIEEYTRSRGFSPARTLREEEGALPLLLSADFTSLWADAASPEGAVPIGLRAGLFHPVTGYSLASAARTATTLAAAGGPLTSARVRSIVRTMVRDHLARSAYERMINRLLFLAGAPQDRHKILARFHRMPQPLVERFYAGTLTGADRVRLLVGKPPVPIAAALRALPVRKTPRAR